MPTYEFLNTKTNEVEEHVIKMADLDAFKKKNKHLERYIASAPAFGFGSFNGDIRSRTPDGFKEVLSKIADQNPTSELANNVRRKSIKEVKTQQVLEKHKKKQAEILKDRLRR